jgi:hypothetical protein
VGKVVAFKKPSLKERHKGNTLCRRGFHKWILESEKKFDVKQGRLVTAWRCQRCGKTKTKAV